MKEQPVQPFPARDRERAGQPQNQRGRDDPQEPEDDPAQQRLSQSDRAGFVGMLKVDLNGKVESGQRPRAENEQPLCRTSLPHMEIVSVARPAPPIGAGRYLAPILKPSSSFASAKR